MELTKEYFDKEISKLVSKQQAERFATKDDLLELPTSNDLRTLRSDIVEIKEAVERIDQRTDEDTRALGRDVADLKRRVSILER